MQFNLKHAGIFISFLLIFFPSAIQGQIVLSEIMFNPSGSEYYTEFIEIYNSSSTDTTDMTGWFISDSSEADQLVPIAQNLILPPLSYGLILDAGYFDNSEIYDAIIPDSALILTINDAAFGSQGLSNSTPEMIILIDSSGDTVATYRYSIDNLPGFSDEKINLYGPDTPDNWANSKTEHGSPGAPNTVRQLDHDLAIKFETVVTGVAPNQLLTVNIAVHNIGLSSATGFHTVMYEDMNRDSILTQNEQIEDPLYFDGTLMPGDSVSFSREMASMSGGLHIFFARVIYEQDENNTNNSIWAEGRVGFPGQALLINEIMYRPSAGSAEWIELFNPGTSAINLQLWQFSDSHIENPVEITKKDIFIEPEHYIVLAEDSSIYSLFPDISSPVIIPDHGFPALNNSGDRIIIRDLIDNVIDDVDYLSSWGSELGVSIERVRSDVGSNDPLNWSLSLHENGGTPGAKNSISPLEYDLSLGLSIEAYKNDSLLITTIVKNVGLQPASQFHCQLYHDSNFDSTGQPNELLTSFFSEEQPLYSGDSAFFHYSMQFSDRGLVQFFSQLIFENDGNIANNTCTLQYMIPIQKHQIILNEIMFYPNSGEPEWIEIYNPNTDAINLNGLQFSDANLDQKHLVSAEDTFVQPGSFAVIAKSNELLQKYPSLTCPIVIPRSWPSLNNTSDEVVLYDDSGSTIDSMAYLSIWEKKQGVSLERFDFENYSTDSSNWGLSLDISGATPGMRNSISPFESDLKISDISFHPQYPNAGEKVDIQITIFNAGKSAISHSELLCYIDVNLDSILQDDEKIGNTIPISQTIDPGDSLIWTIFFTPVQPGRFPIHAEIFSEVDQNPANDSLSAILSVGYSGQSLVINEIMYSPFPNSTEWIEFFNPHSDAVNIQQWMFSDSDTSNRTIITPLNFIIGPSSFLIIAEDSSVFQDYSLSDAGIIICTDWPGLNNDNESIYLFDANSNIIDHVMYSDDWGGGAGTSLERINPLHSSLDAANWSSSVADNGSTPGFTNSIFVDVPPSKSVITIEPNPFSPDGDGHDDVTIINLQLPFNLSQIHVKIFDIRGRLVRFLANNQTAGIQSSIIWDGRNDEGHFCRMGIYIVFIEALHHEQGNVETMKKTVVLARQL